MLKIVFVESQFQDQILLGKRAKDYLYQEFEGFSTETVKEFNIDAISHYPVAVIPLDMPLISAKYLVRLLKTAKKNGLDCLRFGNAESPYGLFLDKCKTKHFVTDTAFLQLGGAKNYILVYNTLRKRIVDRLIDGGAIFLGDEFHVDATVDVEAGATVVSPTTLKGNTRVKSGARVENSMLFDSVIEQGTEVTSSHITASQVGQNSTVGPFARLRGAKIGDNCRIGDFVEVKGSTLNDGAKCAHLCYVGDAEVGTKTNLGCGVVFCNYDGTLKHHTTVGDNCFIGANVNLVAPLSVGDGAYIAAGTTVTKSIPGGAFVIGRARAENKDKKSDKKL